MSFKTMYGLLGLVVAIAGLAFAVFGVPHSEKVQEQQDALGKEYNDAFVAFSRGEPHAEQQLLQALKHTEETLPGSSFSTRVHTAAAELFLKAGRDQQNLRNLETARKLYLQADRMGSKLATEGVPGYDAAKYQIGIAEAYRAAGALIRGQAARAAVYQEALEHYEAATAAVASRDPSGMRARDIAVTISQVKQERDQR